MICTCFPRSNLGTLIVQQIVKQMSRCEVPLREGPIEVHLAGGRALIMVDWEPILRDKILLAVENPDSPVVCMDETRRAD